MSKKLSESHKQIEDLKSELAYNKAILDSLPAVIFINEAWVEDGKYFLKNIWANKTAYLITGWTRDDCDKMGTNFGKLVIHPDDFFISQASYEFHINLENKDKSYGGPYRFKFKNGEFHWGIGFARVLPVDHSSHLQFINCVVPLTEAMQVDIQIQTLINENRLMGKQSAMGKITKTELRVLKLIAQGLSMRKIGEKLFRSEKTIATHKNNLMKKLGMHSLAGLASFAHRHDII